MPDPLVSFRLPDEQHIAITQLAESHGITLSEWLRGMVATALNIRNSGLGNIEEGYMQARSLARQLAHAMIEQALDSLPPTYEEAVARFGAASVARGG